MNAVLIGATGLVGSSILRLLLEDAGTEQVVVLGRRPTGVTHARLVEHTIDFDAPEAWRELVRGDVLFSALGTTVKVAGGKDAQYRVDHTYQLETARAARGNGVATYVLISASGSNPSSPIFYSRMKGELERDVQALGFPRTRILRPGMLDGERTEHRAGEQWGLRVLRALAPVLPAAGKPIPATTVARAALTVAADPTPGAVIYAPRDLFRLG